nr:immunoglobulin light chain junction region [Macaca mulatta]MOX79500.1 immunoglobulin light chain junction region [Macaca mulatta]MOX80298.1 immunoglobulin light chain junction region [Macaca mulatta]MOX81054.1 immunoglobulin light chain junction region [Macaca mulatta]MOX81932.1 immunoglobulin light chain junction region [Macaca mulatta]
DYFCAIGHSGGFYIF